MLASPARVRVQERPFDLGLEANAFAASLSQAGAVVTFTGLVRDNGGQLQAMEIEHYPGMTERAIAAMMAEAKARFALEDALVIHRHGRVVPGDNIVLVLAASVHREAAFHAAEFLMDYLKTNAPFWKSEERANGTKWVEARADDDDALARWTR